MRTVIKKIIPTKLLKWLRPTYHGLSAILASRYYHHPSRSLIVIGVTGTGGKSTTINLLARILNFNSRKTGFITTTNFSDGDKTILNKHGLSMPGPWLLQQQLTQIMLAGCQIAIVECTSEGLAQNRHLGIDFDVALLTNLSPAHIDAHGSFENYKQAKGKLFESLLKSRITAKKLPNKIIGVNIDSNHSDYFLQFKAEQKFTITFKNKVETGVKQYTGEIKKTQPQIDFQIGDIELSLPLLGEFNAYNAFLAIATADQLGIPIYKSDVSLREFPGVPGRMEEIPNRLKAKIIVDYACEPSPLTASLKAVSELPHGRIIHVVGATGGHRDINKQFEFGEISSRFADVIIITNDDVYDSDPAIIAHNICSGAEKSAKENKLDPEIKIILDRKEAITEAIASVRENDIVLITGKGSEQFLILPGNKRIEWDDREIIKQVLER